MSLLRGPQLKASLALLSLLRLRNRHHSVLSSFFGTSSVAKNSARAKPIAHQLSIEFGIGPNGARNKKRGESNRASGRPTYEAHGRKCPAIKVRRTRFLIREEAEGLKLDGDIVEDYLKKGEKLSVSLPAYQTG